MKANKLINDLISQLLSKQAANTGLINKNHEYEIIIRKLETKINQLKIENEKLTHIVNNNNWNTTT